MLNLFGKEKYVMHYWTLQFCIEQELKIGEFHRNLQFEGKSVAKTVPRLQPTFKNSNIIRDDLQLVENSILWLMLNRPVESRFSVPKRPKLHKYRYYYHIV